MPNLGSIRSLQRAALVVFTLLVLAGIWGATAQRILSHRIELRQYAERELHGAQKTLHAHMRRTLEGVLVLMAGTNLRLSENQQTLPELIDTLRRLQQFDSDPADIGFVGQDRQIWRLSVGPGHTADVANRDYVAALAQAEPGTVYVAAVTHSRLSGRQILTLAMKALPNGYGVDIVIGAVPVDHFTAAYSDLLLSAPTYIGILRQDGYVLHMAPDPKGVVGSYLADGYLEALRLRKGSSGVVQYDNGQSAERLLAGYAMLERLPLTIFVGLDLAELEARWRNGLPRPLLLASLASLLCLGFMTLLLMLMRRRDTEAAELRRALLAAEAANNAKRQFMARMSHELRTPLNAILGFSEVLATGILGPLSQTYRGYGQDIHRSGQHLLGLVNQVLEIAKLEAGAMPLEEKPCLLGDLIGEAVCMMQSAADKKRLRIHVGPLPPARLQADPLLLRQMLLNLLSNAVKYSDPGGGIAITVATQPDGLAICVSDTGQGIAEERKPHIFEPFGHGNALLARPDDGFGLGLPIVRALIELHGGRIELRSAPRQGTAATLLFPQQRVIPIAA